MVPRSTISAMPIVGMKTGFQSTDMSASAREIFTFNAGDVWRFTQERGAFGHFEAIHFTTEVRPTVPVAVPFV